MAASKVIKQEYDPAVDIDSIYPYPGNARKHNEKVLDESIEENGFYGAVVCQKSTRFVIIGNGRRNSLKRHGNATIPVIWVDVSDSKAREMNLMDNRAGDLASYDPELLASLLSAVASDPESSLRATGFDQSDLDQLLDSIAGEELPDPGDAESESSDEQWSIIVECSGEKQQRDLLERFEREGLQCKAIVL